MRAAVSNVNFYFGFNHELTQMDTNQASARLIRESLHRRRRAHVSDWGAHCLSACVRASRVLVIASSDDQLWTEWTE